MPAESDVLVPGPWAHRDVSANGTRFHVAEAGDGPLVLLLHGFPQFWWMWRHQLVGLAEAGHRVVAPDLRGYGASDKPPRGYDAYTLAADVAGLVRALGEQKAVIAGHDWGGAIAWVVAALHPEVVERLVITGTAHPLRHREAVFADPRGQLRASAYMLGAQTPWLAERNLVKDDATRVVELLEEWGGPGFPTEDDRAIYRQAMLIPGVAHCSLEYYRWWVRSVARPTGYRFFKRLQRPVTAPTLHLHGALDTCVLPRTALGSGRYVEAQYEWRLLDGVGHFVAEEAPDLVTGEIARWAK
ncbi:MAG TPA: alpha/beta hydrolase [Frankiaceae bacterium]|jgi:pimeloyl-ACP methyl ester carboxylesterase|nr:alpha/beta hydrolase [Frankiaceae bacterium]